MDGPIYHLERVVKVKAEDLEDFVGPLDLILHLLNKNKMEIKDIQISLILDQYLQWMSQRKELDLEVASEFVTMASHLVYIKTRMLLSIHDEEALSEMEQLIATLEAHQRNESYLKIREVIPQLDQQYSVGRDCLTRRRRPIRPNRSYRYVHPKEDLRRAIQAVLSRTDHKLPRRYPPSRASWAGALPRGGKGFGTAPAAAPSGGSPVSGPVPGQPEPLGGGGTFLAVLELCKDRRLRLAGTAEDCTVTCTGPGEETESGTTERTED